MIYPTLILATTILYGSHISAPHDEHEISIYDTRDITFSVPYFDNAPNFNMDIALQGGRGRLFSDPPHKVESDRKKNEEELDDLLWDLFGEDHEFIRWRGHLIIRESRWK